MACIYVASSKTLSTWGASVGISKHLFKIGIAAGSGKDAVAALNEAGCAGAADWALVKAEDAAELDEDAALANIARKEAAIDPTYYPRLKGAAGIFRIKPETVENGLIIEKAMANETGLNFKLKPTHIADYFIKKARG